MDNLAVSAFSFLLQIYFQTAILTDMRVQFPLNCYQSLPQKKQINYVCAAQKLSYIISP